MAEIDLVNLDQNATKSMLPAALAIAASGISIIAVAPGGKKPIYANWQNESTTDEATIRDHWGRSPAANIGTVPGRWGAIVIDADCKKGSTGLQSLKSHGLLDYPTATVRTPSGGLHLYFRRPQFKVGNSRLLGEGIDLRCDGGQCLMPPSVLMPSEEWVAGTYRWIGAEPDLAELPSHVLQLLMPKTVVARESFAFAHPVATDDLRPRIHAYMDRLPTGLSEGQGRNNSIYGFCAWLTHDLGLRVSEAECWAHEYNHRFAEPLGTRELEKTVESAMKHGARPVGAGRASLMRRRARTFGATFGNGR